MKQGLAIDYNLIRKTIADQIQSVTGLISILEEAEGPYDKRPKLPYFSFKITTPGAKSGDDSKEQTLDDMGNPTSIWNSGGCRKMVIDFNAYATTHEEAFNYMATWQTALDLADIQQNLRAVGIAVWIIGTVADLSKLLNTGYEGRAHLECSFGVAMNLQSDLGYMDTVTVDGTITTDQGQEVETSETVTVP
jgi:hypothetical protein